jgi:hypothetical protein
MPLIKYFGFVGSALVLLLIGSGWCFPQPPSEPPEPPGGVTDRPAIRIASAERLPERVIIDTSLPTIVSPPSVWSLLNDGHKQLLQMSTPSPSQQLRRKLATSRQNRISQSENVRKRWPFIVRCQRRISNLRGTTKRRPHLQSPDCLCWTS